MAGESPKSKTQRAYEAFSLASLGLEMGVAVFLGWALGQWLDRKFGTDPWLMLFFLLIGVAAGFKAVFRVVRQAKSDFEESNE